MPKSTQIESAVEVDQGNSGGKIKRTNYLTYHLLYVPTIMTVIISAAIQRFLLKVGTY